MTTWRRAPPAFWVGYRRRPGVAASRRRWGTQAPCGASTSPPARYAITPMRSRPTLRSSRVGTKRRWTKRALASAAVLAAAACPRPTTVPSPGGGEPELRVALAVGAPSVVLGGDGGGELFVTDDGNGQPVGSIPAGARWTAVPDSASGGTNLRLLKPDGTATEAHRGIAVVNVTENRFAMANGRRYRGRIHVIAGRSGVGAGSL